MSTYLRRGGGSAGPDASQRERREPRRRRRRAGGCPADIGRRYAEVSGDRNPIHLTADRAGCSASRGRSRTACGRKARCLAAFEGRLPDAYTVDVAFKTPVLLPAKVGFAATPDESGWRFELFGARNGKPHLEGFVGTSGLASAA